MKKNIFLIKHFLCVFYLCRFLRQDSSDEYIKLETKNNIPLV